jgi:hypothetical protein
MSFLTVKLYAQKFKLQYFDLNQINYDGEWGQRNASTTSHELLRRRVDVTLSLIADATEEAVAVGVVLPLVAIEEGVVLPEGVVAPELLVLVGGMGENIFCFYGECCISLVSSKENNSL